jgi:hypothetical protein
VSNNEETDENEGKGDWFPQLESSPKACWENLCEATEQPVLLDPVKKGDVRLIDVQVIGASPREGSTSPDACDSRKALDCVPVVIWSTILRKYF